MNTAAPSPMASPVAGVHPAALRGIRKAVVMANSANGNLATKNGAVHDGADDIGGDRTVKECPECGESFTGDLRAHTHKTEMGKSLTGIRAHLRKSDQHCQKCIGPKALMKCETCGCHRSQDAHESDTQSGKENVGIRGVLKSKGGIRDFVKGGPPCASCGSAMKRVAETHATCENEHCDDRGVAKNITPRSAEVQAFTNVAARRQIKDARANHMGELR